MIVGDEEKAVVLVLHLDKVLQCTEIIPQMEISGGTYTAANYIFTHILFYLFGIANIHFFFKFVPCGR